MKKLILLELTLLFLSTTFRSDNPPGWYQQTMPVNKEINDIYFTDSLNGWAATTWAPQFDTAYVLHTTNGGDNWDIQFKEHASFIKIQFINSETGYLYGGTGFGKFWGTTNSGLNWNVINSNLPIYSNSDMFFINKDTGWICSNIPGLGGLAKTTNGGISFFQQLNESYRPQILFFINKDTGWMSNSSWKLYKTLNGGTNWNLIYDFSPNGIGDIFFVSKDTGYLSGGGGSSSIKKTINGGFSWFPTNNSTGGKEIFFMNSKTGWICDVFSTIEKTTDTGLNWFGQYAPQGYYYSIQFVDTSKGWSGGTKMIKTTDGGGPTSISGNGNTIPDKFILNQNYPNPFNPRTVISYELRVTGYINLKVYDIQGKEINILVNQKQNAGEYKIVFDGSGLNSGVYFYKIELYDEKSNLILTDSKRMVLIK